MQDAEGRNKRIQQVNTRRNSKRMKNDVDLQEKKNVTKVTKKAKKIEKAEKKRR